MRPDAPLVALAYECQLFPELAGQPARRLHGQGHHREGGVYRPRAARAPNDDGAAEPCAVVDDTYAEAFRSLYAEVLITARDRTWLDHALHAATGNASSTILCDCEAGLDRYVGPGGDESFATPDGRPARSSSSTCRASARTASRPWSARCWCASARTC